MVFTKLTSYDISLLATPLFTNHYWCSSSFNDPLLALLKCWSVQLYLAKSFPHFSSLKILQSLDLLITSTVIIINILFFCPYTIFDDDAVSVTCCTTSLLYLQHYYSFNWGSKPLGSGYGTRCRKRISKTEPELHTLVTHNYTNINNTILYKCHNNYCQEILLNKLKTC